MRDCQKKECDSEKSDLAMRTVTERVARLAIHISGQNATVFDGGGQDKGAIFIMGIKLYKSPYRTI